MHGFCENAIMKEMVYGIKKDPMGRYMILILWYIHTHIYHIDWIAIYQYKKYTTENHKNYSRYMLTWCV